MSLKGKILRGEKWFHLNRDPDGNLTEEVKKDKDKMKDINTYLETIKAEEEKKTKSKGKK